MENFFKRIYLLIFLLSFSFLYAQTDTSLIMGYDEVTKVVDGDTFKFKKLDKSTRLLCLDTEETFKGKYAEKKTSEIRDNWLQYYYEQKEEMDSSFPIKLDSPFGFDTAEWAKEFMKDVTRVRLEKDDTLRNIDMYDRYLVYIFAEKNGKWVNYNLECVRQGYSPYFNKYGNSARFHNDFVEAQNYAKQNKLGIWNPNLLHYPDYEERIAWWNERANQLDWFNKNYLNKPGVINLLNADASKLLQEYEGKEVLVFGTLSEIMKNRFPYLFRISISRYERLDFVLNEGNSEILKDLDLKKMDAYYFYGSGKLEGKNGKYKIYIKDKSQIRFE